MSEFRDMVISIQDDIEQGELSFQQIAVKYDVSLREVDTLAFDLMDRDLGYVADEGYEDRYLDAAYEDRYSVEDF